LSLWVFLDRVPQEVISTRDDILLAASLKQLITEARRRRVFRVAGLYIVAAWVVVQVALAAFPALSISDTAVRYVWLAALLGFPVVMFFGWRYDIRDGRIVKTSADGADAPLGLQRADFIVLAAIGIVAVVILAGTMREITSMEPSEPLLPSLDDIDSASVAVLPFVNMSNDEQNEYFSDGLTETLLHMLAQLPDLKVSARTSAFSFKNKNVDIRTIALALGVAHVLEGSVQKFDDRIRVTVQLIRADDGFHVWSQNYDRTLDDVFAIQDDISADVASALGSSLLTAQAGETYGVNTEDFSAYDLYLQALEQQNIASYDALLEAQRLFTAAIDRDPDFVDAKLGLARNYIWQWYKDFDDADRFDLTALDLIDEVLEQQPNSRTAQLMRTLMRFYIGRSEQTHWGVSDESRTLVDDMLVFAESGSFDSFLTRALVSIISGGPWHHEEEALELLRRALEADPLNYELLWAQSLLFRRLDRPEEAKQPLLTAAEIAPQNPLIPQTLGYLAFNQGRYAEGLEWSRRAAVLDPDDPLLTKDIASVFYALDMLDEGDYWYEQTEARASDECLMVSLEATAADAASDTERLLERVTNDLERSVADPDFCKSFQVPIDYFVWTMSELDQSQQALDYLEELVPTLYDGKILPGHKQRQYIQILAVFLHYDVMDTESFREFARGYNASWAEISPDWRSTTAPVYLISTDYVMGNVEQAKSLFLERYTHTYHWRWRQFLKYPWLAEFREDPEVAARIDEYLQKKARFADDARTLLDRPEWQH
jgi:TolB-like protein